MIWLIDNDFIKKMAIYNLLDSFLESVWIVKEDVRVLPEAKYWFGIAGKKKQKRIAEFAAPVYERIRGFFDGTSAISVEPNADLLLLNEVGIEYEIDEGEAVLLAATAAIPSFRIATGDKRCLKGVYRCPECRHIADRIRGHVVCLEQAILYAIDFYGFEYVKERVVPGRPTDQVIDTMIFSREMETPEDHAREGLRSYIRHLRSETGGLLHEAP